MSDPYAVIVTWMDGSQETYQATSHRLAHGELVLYYDAEAVTVPEVEAWHLPLANIRVWKPDYKRLPSDVAVVQLTQIEAQWLSVVAANALRRDAEDMVGLPHHRTAWEKLQPACRWVESADAH